MKAEITITQKVDLSTIKLGDKDLLSILSDIHSEVFKCMQDISLERQNDKPNLDMIDAPLCVVLDTLEKIFHT